MNITQKIEAVRGACSCVYCCAKIPAGEKARVSRANGEVLKVECAACVRRIDSNENLSTFSD